jgi:hypothetical protein
MPGLDPGIQSSPALGRRVKSGDDRRRKGVMIPFFTLLPLQEG